MVRSRNSQVVRRAVRPAGSLLLLASWLRFPGAGVHWLQAISHAGRVASSMAWARGYLACFPAHALRLWGGTDRGGWRGQWALHSFSGRPRVAVKAGGSAKRTSILTVAAQGASAQAQLSCGMDADCKHLGEWLQFQRAQSKNTAAQKTGTHIFFLQNFEPD